MIRKALGIEITVQADAPRRRFYHMGLEVPEDIYNLLQIDLYRGIEWQTRSQPKGVLGGIYPIKHPGHLVHEVANRVPVLAGLSGEAYGHVVLVSGISFHSRERLDIGAPKHVPGPDTYVEWVEVVDPAHLALSPYKIPGDKFFEQAQFLFSIYHPR